MRGFRGLVVSRVFVSFSHRDRAVGEELGGLVRALGHEALDDRDERQGTAWWNEVVGRIQDCDVFVAVASKTYVEAQTCRLAAKHAAAAGLPVVRVDLDRKVAADCHPVVADAVGVPYAPHDPRAIAQLTQALADPTEPLEAEEAPPPEPTDRLTARRWLPLQILAAVAAAVAVNAWLYVNLQDDEQGGGTTGRRVSAPGADASAPPPDAGPATVPTSSTMTLLAQVEAAGGAGLPAASCVAGESSVTCTKPATNIATVVLTAYPDSAALYDAYTETVRQLSGDPVPENTGNCSAAESEGEVGWNTDLRHTSEFSVAEQRAGGLDPATQTAGRVFCTDSQQVMRLVWTQDPGLLVTATGQPSELVVAWWADVHLDLACASGLGGTGCQVSG